MVARFDFFKNKYGEELLIDLIRLESLQKYISSDKAHTLSYFDITLITSGYGRFYIDDKMCPLLPGLLLFSAPGQVRQWEFEEIPKGLVLIFEEEFLCDFFNDTDFVQNLAFFNYEMPSLFVPTSDFRHLIKLLLEIEKEIDEFQKNDVHILRALLYQILTYLNRKYLAACTSLCKPVCNHYIMGFKRLVNNNFTKEHSVSYYADKLNITPGHLNDLVKQWDGINAKKYIQKRIMLEARRLLLYSDLTISEIANNLNYEDLSYFIRVFRKISGVAPLNYKKQKHP